MSDFKDLFGNWRPGDEEPDERSSEDFPEPENRKDRPLNEKEVRVVNVYEGIYESPGGASPTVSNTFVLLRDNRGREFKIFVLRDVGLAISMGLEQELPERPFTHDLMKNIIDRLGASVERVTIDDLWQDTFYAKVSIVRDGQTFDIDARPSDAIALALRCRVPIYAAEAVLEAAHQE